MFKKVIFDVDGVLVDSAPEMYRGCRAVFAQLGQGLRVPSYDDFLKTVQTPFSVYYRELGVKGTDEEITRAYFSAARHDEAPLFPDVINTLQALADANVRLAIVSGHHQASLEKRFTERGLADYFDAIVGNASNKVEAIRRLCASAGVDPESTCLVGDLISDARDGRDAGVKVVGCTRGNPTMHALRHAGAHHVIRDLDGLVHLIHSNPSVAASC
ncbi:MAG: HAD family hydrolase [Patescibacteria group bacterium]